MIRPLQPGDDIRALTEMLRRAYAPLAERGLRFTATHQTEEVTARRLARGYPLVAARDGRVTGTITVYRSDPESPAAWYREPGAFQIGQFGVDPAFKGKGIGRALHRAAVDYASGQGARFLALDTAAPAAELIETYDRWGYAVTERVRWEDVNYDSVIMVRVLMGESIQLRQAKPEDAEAIARVQTDAWRAAYRDWVPGTVLRSLDVSQKAEFWRAALTGSGRVTLALANRETAGFCRVTAARDVEAAPGAAEIVELYVSPSHWRRGVGRALCDTALRDAAADGFDEVALRVLDMNEPAVRFYETLGFRSDGTAAMERITRETMLPVRRMRRSLP